MAKNNESPKIVITKRNKKRMDKIAIGRETYDDIQKRLLDCYEKHNIKKTKKTCKEV